MKKFHREFKIYCIVLFQIVIKLIITVQTSKSMYNFVEKKS